MIANSVPGVMGWLSIDSLDRTRVFSRLAFAAVAFTFLAVTVFTIINAFHWLNKPFPGFLLNARMVVADYGKYDWPGIEAGLRRPDKLISANDQKIETGSDLAQVLQNSGIGNEVTYLFDRKGKQLNVTFPTMKFTGWDLFATFGIEFAAALLYFGLGVVVFIMKPDTELSWVFFLACSWLGVYVITGFDTVSTHLCLLPYQLATVALPASFAHMSMVFPYRAQFIGRHPWLVFIPYVISAIVFVPYHVFYPGPVFLALYPFIYLYFFLSAISPVAAGIVAFFKGDSTLAKQRAKVILFGAALTFPLPGVAYVLPFVGGSWGQLKINANFLVLALLIYPACIAYAISKHNLFDVDVYIKRAVGYGLMTAILAVTYTSLHMSTTAFIGPLFGSQGEVIHAILFALLVVFFFNPLNHRIQEGVDRLFFRKQYDFKATVGSISNVLTSVTDLHEIIKHVIQNVRRELFLDSAGVILLDHDKKNCEAFFLTDGARRGTEQQQDLILTYDDPLLAVLAQERAVLTKYDIEEDPRYASVRESCSQRFLDMGASLALPLFHGNDFTGMFTLGHKKSGHFYTREDIDLLKTVSSMTSTAIQEAREKGQREILMQLFSKHVSSEVAETIWQQRDHFLDGGRPRPQLLTATVLFTDLAGFSSVSEKTDPQALMTWLNAYLDVVAKTIIDHHGVIDDYFGDGMKANFGVPVPRTTEAEIRQDAINAVNCALDMERQITRLNAAMQEQGRPPLRMRVGIYTGSVVAGSLGSSSRLKYTTVGDTVNIASRLESFDKDLILPHLATSPCRILIGESTLSYLESDHKTQPVGELSLKGKDEKITAYCVLCRDEEQPPQLETA